MPQSDCPHCHESFRVPETPLPRDAQGRCPWCGASFPLDDVLEQLPPMLELFTAGGEPIELDEALSAAPVSAAGGTDWGGLDSNREPESEGIPGIVLGESSRPGAPNVEQPPRSDVESLPVGVAAQPSPMRVQPNPAIELRHKKRRSSPLRTLIGIALGPVIALPIAGAILLALDKEPDLGFYPFDGTYGDQPERRAAPIPLDDGTQTPSPNNRQPAPRGRSLSDELGADLDSPSSGVDKVGGLSEVPPDQAAALAEFNLEGTGPSGGAADESTSGSTAGGADSDSAPNMGVGQPPEPAEQPPAEPDGLQGDGERPQPEGKQKPPEDSGPLSPDPRAATGESADSDGASEGETSPRDEVSGGNGAADDAGREADDGAQRGPDGGAQRVTDDGSTDAHRDADGDKASDRGDGSDAAAEGPRNAGSAETVTSTDANEATSETGSRPDRDEATDQPRETTPTEVVSARDSAIERLEAVSRVDAGERQRYRTQLAYAYQSVAKLAGTAGREHQDSLSAVTDKLREAGLVDVFAKAAPDWLSLPHKSRGTDGALLVGDFEETPDGYALRLNDRRAVAVRLSDPGQPPGRGKQMVLGRMRNDQSELVVDVLLSEPVQR